MRNKKLSIEAKAIYAYLSSFAGNKGECYPSIDLILNELNISKTRFYKYIDQLINFNIISKYQKKNKNRWKNVIYKINYCLESQSLQNEDTQNEDTNNNSFNNNNLNNNNINNNTYCSELLQAHEPEKIN